MMMMMTMMMIMIMMMMMLMMMIKMVIIVMRARWFNEIQEFVLLGALPLNEGASNSKP